MEDNHIKFRFYNKPKGSKFCLMRKSAISWNKKRATLTKEVWRRALNCSDDLNEEMRDGIFKDYYTKLMHTGYSKGEASNTI